MKLFRLAIFLGLAGFGAMPGARGHQTLYENIEVNLHDPATIRIEFIIHAPELPTPVAAGIDPSSVDPAWLGTLSDEAIGALIAEADQFLRGVFVCSMVSPQEEEPVNVLGKTEVRFEPIEAIRNPPPDTKLPPGCLLVTVTLPNPGPPNQVSIGFAPHAQKRLMVSVSRPAAFPKIHDLAPGESVTTELPVPPQPPDSPVLNQIAVALGLGVLGALLLWRLVRR